MLMPNHWVVILIKISLLNDKSESHLGWKGNVKKSNSHSGKGFCCCLFKGCSMKQYHANVKTVIVTISHFTTVILCTNSKVLGYIDLGQSLFITKKYSKVVCFPTFRRYKV